MKISKSWGIPAVLFAVFVWGISFVCTKVVLTDLPPVSIAFFRQFIAIVPLVFLVRSKKENFKIQKNELLIFILATFFGIVLYFYFENKGLTLTTASNASMLVSAVPAFVLISESIFKRTKIALSSLLCVIASILGVYFVIFDSGTPDFSSDTIIGNLLILCALFSWIVYTFLSDKLGKKYSSLKMTTLQTFFSIPLFTPFILDEVKYWQIPSTISVFNLIFLGVFCSALAYVFYLFGIKTLGPVLPSALLNLIPVVTIFTGVLFLNESISPFQIIGTILIIGSLSFLSLMRLKKDKTAIDFE